MIPAFQQHCQPYTEFVQKLGQYADDFTRLSGSDDHRPSRIREFLKAHDYTLKDGADWRAAMAAFAAYMIDFHNCRVRPAGWFRKSLVIRRGSWSGDFVDLFYRVMFEGLEIPEDLIDRRVIEDDEPVA